MCADIFMEDRQSKFIAFSQHIKYEQSTRILPLMSYPNCIGFIMCVDAWIHRANIQPKLPKVSNCLDMVDMVFNLANVRISECSQPWSGPNLQVISLYSNQIHTKTIVIANQPMSANKFNCLVSGIGPTNTIGFI